MITGGLSTAKPEWRAIQCLCRMLHYKFGMTFIGIEERLSFKERWDAK